MSELTSVPDYVYQWLEFQQKRNPVAATMLGKSRQGKHAPRMLLSLQRILLGCAGQAPTEKQFARITAPWDGIAYRQACLLYYLHEGDEPDGDEATTTTRSALQQPYQYALSIAQDLIRVFDRDTMPLLFQGLCNLRELAIRYDADVEAMKNSGAHKSDGHGHEGSKTEEAARTIMRAFNFCLNDRAPLESSRKWGTYYILSLLFKTYIQLKTINLCKNSLRAIGAATLPPLESFPKSHVVSFRFYLGFFHFWHEEYRLAMDDLMYAFQHCPAANKHNKRLILRYLLPTALLHGRLPHPKLLKRHGLQDMYGEICQALRTGNLQLFQSAMGRNEHALVAQGTYMVVERVRMLCLRGLVKKVWLLLERTTRLPVASVQAGLHASGTVMDAEETECMCCVLIAKGFMKGYISREKQMIVLSKGAPFPPIPQVISAIGGAGAL